MATSTFDDDFAADALPDLLDEFGVAATWHVHGGGDLDIVAMAGDEGRHHVHGEHGTSIVRTRRLTVPTVAIAGVTEAVSDPHPDDEVTLGALRYAVIEIVGTGGGTAVVEAARWDGGDESLEGLREALTL